MRSSAFGSLSTWFLLWLSVATPMVNGFASYLLSSSSCYVELTTEEVIMNNMVQKAQSDAPLKIELLTGNEDSSITGAMTPLPDFENDVSLTLVSVETFPVTVQLKVVPSAVGSTVGGYEYILQVDEESSGSFEKGSCEGNKRIAGQGANMAVQLHVPEPNVMVWGGWAAGHEAVKLLHGYKFISTDDEATDL